MSIIVLDENTANKIAAGEVIENPSNIVKELVENAVDSGAKNINVEIRDGGKSLIKVVDDGMGFEYEDIKLAFLKHATSKLAKIEDIYSICSYGFRGEALSSIAAVSCVTLITKNRNNSDVFGFKYDISFGKEGSLDKAASNYGTTIEIRNLFENVPVRKKFLKSDSKEAASVEDIVIKFAITRPDIKFTYIVDSYTKFKSNADNSLGNVLYEIYGKEIYDNLLEVRSSINGINIDGYIARPSVSRNNRNDEIYFINSRFVKNNVVNKAIEDAYAEFLMQHKFPLAVLNIDVDKKTVDVNVHPKKAEVRFSNDEYIYYAVYNAVYNALKNSNLIHDEKFDYSESDLLNNYIHRENGHYEINSEKGLVNQIAIDFKELPSLSNDEVKINPISVKATRKLDEKPFIQKTLTEDHKYIGQIFDTYILVEFEDKLYIIDQHAAHEKINFEKLYKSYKENKIVSQKIFPSIMLKLNPIQMDVVKTNLDEFVKLGYEIELFGDNDIKVDAVPYNIVEIGKKELLLEMIDSLSDMKLNGEYQDIVEKIASMSCKKAIKANHILSEIEVKNLLRELFKLDNPYNCPHGRPTIISLSKYEFEKKFGRIV